MNTLRQVGDRIAGRFEVFAVHQGGMGVVCEVEDLRRTYGPRYLALKSLAPWLLADPVRTARFQTECQLWIRLGAHPNIVQAFAVEELEGVPHLVLERVAGGELSQRIGSRELDLKRSLSVGVAFCLGMEHALREGLRCHRDIKPGNLMFTSEGVLKITDFGIAGLRDEFLAWPATDLERPIEIDTSAPSQPIVFDDPRDRVDHLGSPSLFESASPHERLRDPAPPALTQRFDSSATQDYAPPGRDDSTLSSQTFARLTQTGSLLGTLPYMAPEQFIDAHEVDVRADIYSFGVVLYQMLTGRLPFEGDSVAKFARKHARSAIPSILPALSKASTKQARAVDAVIQTCLAKKPDDRFAELLDLRKALSNALRG